MGDSYDRDRAARRKRFGGTLPPEPILTWGIGASSSVGHNGGPPLDEEPGYLLRKFHWTKAYNDAWKPPSMAVLKFRVERAEAAGLTYEQYMSEWLDTGRHLQKEDGDKRKRGTAKPTPLGGPAPVQAQGPQPAQSRPQPAGRPKPQPLGGPKQK